MYATKAGCCILGPKGPDLYSELNNLSGLSAYLVQVNGSVEIEALGGGLCGFSGEVVVYPTLSVPEFSGACADAVPDVGEAYRIVTYALDNVPGWSVDDWAT